MPLGLDQLPEDAAKQAQALKTANVIMIISAVSILFCCVGGILATWFASQAKQDADAGDLKAASTKTIIAAVLMGLSFLSGLGALTSQLSQIR